MCSWSGESTKGGQTALARLSKQTEPTVEYRYNLDSKRLISRELWHDFEWSPRSSMLLVRGEQQHADSYLFHHYMQVSALQLAGRVVPENPFLRHLISVALENTAVLQCILAISGAHLLATSERYERDTRSYHAVSLRGVKHALVDWRKASSSQLITLLTCTLLLSIFEVRSTYLSKSNFAYSYGFNRQS